MSYPTEEPSFPHTRRMTKEITPNILQPQYVFIVDLIEKKQEQKAPIFYPRIQISTTLPLPTFLPSILLSTYLSILHRTQIKGR